MNKFSNKNMPHILTLSPSAIARIKALQAKKSDMIGLRVGIAVKGCSGYVHTLDYAMETDTSPAEDTKIEQEGITVFVEEKAIPIVFGTTLEWVEEELDARFVFHNPNAKSSCGCGESFNVREL